MSGFVFMISAEAIKEFKEIYKSVFGVTLSDADALHKATNLLNLYTAVYKPIEEDVREVH